MSTKAGGSNCGGAATTAATPTNSAGSSRTSSTVATSRTSNLPTEVRRVDELNCPCSRAHALSVL